MFLEWANPLPLVFFAPVLKAARLRGVAQFESLCSRYSQDFDPRWLKSTAVSKEEILGSSDFQSLADLGTGYDRVSKMGIFPATIESVKKLAVYGALPFLPLALLVLPAKDLVKAVVKLVL